MAKCTRCGKSRHWKLADGRRKCRYCGHRFSPRSIWALSRLSERTKHQLLEWFVLGVPVYRQRFRGRASAPATERFYRLVRAMYAYQEELRGPLAGQSGDRRDHLRRCPPRQAGLGRRGQGDRLRYPQAQRLGAGVPGTGANSQEIVGRVVTETRPGSLYYTDDWQAYASFWPSVASTSSSTSRKAAPKVVITSMGSRGSGVTLRTGCTPYAGYPGATSISTSAKWPSVSIIAPRICYRCSSD